jgi:hypothetical protein
MIRNSNPGNHQDLGFKTLENTVEPISGSRSHSNIITLFKNFKRGNWLWRPMIKILSMVVAIPTTAGC